MASDPTIPIAQAEQTLNQVITGADAHRAAGLSHLSTVRQAKSEQWTRERTRLAKLLGDGHPAVVALNQRIAVNASLVTALGVASDQAQTDVPVVDKGGWVVHGRVRDAAFKPQPAMTVALYDENKKWLQQFGYASTDQTGYFLIRYKPQAATERTSEAAVITTGAITTAHLQVLDAKGRTVHIDSEALALQPDQAYYREIVLTGELVGQPPPGDPQPGRK